MSDLIYMAVPPAPTGLRLHNPTIDQDLLCMFMCWYDVLAFEFMYVHKCSKKIQAIFDCMLRLARQ